MVLLNVIAFAVLAQSSPDLYPDNEIGGGGTSAGAAYTSCSGDRVVFDNNGVEGCSYTTDTAPQSLIVHPQDNYPGGTQTASDLWLRGGIDETKVVIDSYADCETDTVTVTINGTAMVLTEPTDWNAATSNAVTCAALATAVDALAGVTASCSTASILITPDLTTRTVALTSASDCLTETTGTNGNILTYSPIVTAADIDLNAVGDVLIDADGNTKIESGTADQFRFFVGGTEEFQMTATAFRPITDGGSDLGAGTNGQFQNAYLVSGGALNYGNGGTTITGTTGDITLAGLETFAITQQIATSGVPVAMIVTGAAHTGLTAATEDIGVNFNLSASKTWASGAGPLAAQREFVLQAPTYIGDVAGALTITQAATMVVTGPPVAGANMTLTSTDALWIDAGQVRLDDHVHWDVGTAVTAGDYSIGRDADGTNQMHLNVPTGAGWEFSVNDVAEALVNATGLILSSGNLISFDAGDVTATHSANALAFAGASSGYSFDANASVSVADNPLSLKNTTDGASVQLGIAEGDRATATDGDAAYVTYRLSDSGGTQTELARMTITADDVTDATEDGSISWALVTAGAALADELRLDGASLSPATTDGSALGVAGSKEWSDAAFAGGAVLAFGNDVTVTHATDTLTIAGGNVDLAGTFEFTSGVAMTAGDYEIARDADATNQLHFNVPTGATFEWSVNDAAEMILSATDLSPEADDGLTLGATNTFKAIYIGDGTAGSGFGINAGEGDWTISNPSTNVMTWAGMADVVVSGTGTASGAHTLLDAIVGGNSAITAASEQPDFKFNMSATETWAAGAGPLAAQRNAQFLRPTLVGDAGGALTITQAATVYIDGPPVQGSNMTLSSTDALWIDAGQLRMDDHVHWDAGVAVTAGDYSVGRDADGTNQLHLNVPTGAGFEFSVNDTAEMTLSATVLNLTGANLTVTGQMATAVQSATMGAAATNFAVTRNVVKLVDDGDGSTLTTITGGLAGQLLTIIFDTAQIITVTDGTCTADAIMIAAAYASTADDTLTIAYDGTCWREVSRSVN